MSMRRYCRCVVRLGVVEATKNRVHSDFPKVLWSFYWRFKVHRAAFRFDSLERDAHSLRFFFFFFFFFGGAQDHKADYSPRLWDSIYDHLF